MEQSRTRGRRPAFRFATVGNACKATEVECALIVPDGLDLAAQELGLQEHRSPNAQTQMVLELLQPENFLQRSVI